jgi:hypothetical protein
VPHNRPLRSSIPSNVIGIVKYPNNNNNNNNNGRPRQPHRPLNVQQQHYNPEEIIHEYQSPQDNSYHDEQPHSFPQLAPIDYSGNFGGNV